MGRILAALTERPGADDDHPFKEASK